MSYAEIGERERRLDLLRLLEEAPEYTSSQWVLYQALADGPTKASSDQVAADLAWLEEQRLVALRKVGDLTMATIITRGIDVAQGRARCPGVARPRPGV